MISKSFKMFGLSVFILSTVSLTGCSEKVMNLPSQLAELQQKLNESAENFKVETPAKVPEKKMEAAPTQDIKQENKIKNTLATPVKRDIPLNNTASPNNSVLPEEVKNLLGEWDYKFFGQEIDVKVQENNEVFSTNFNFNGYDYQASGKLSEITEDGITVKGDYYGEPVVVKLESLDPEKMNFTFLEGGKNIPDFIKGIPLVFNKK